MIFGLVSYVAYCGLAMQRTSDFRSWAPTPPMGWNSWDCFGTSVTEEQFKANATVMARELKSSGYTIATVDIQWYEPDAKGFEYRPNANVVMDGYGRLLPAPNRFPSAAKGGFKSLAAWTHKQGLKFGIHLMRGIPRRAVEQNLPVFGTSYRAQDIADRSSVCGWNPDMYGVDMRKPGAQEYYNSVFKLIASWGVDFVKVDDLSRPYAEHKPEIEAIRRAIDASGRKILLSMSPGETPVSEMAHATEHANMWRISDDFWDSWPALFEQFERLRKWNPAGGGRKTGAWPDADMLPLGWLAHGSRKTNFTIDEQRTLMTLWGIARSPLIIGADLSRADEQLLDLLRQPDVIRMNQRGYRPAQVFSERGLVAWETSISGSKDRFLAVFNTSGPFSQGPDSMNESGLVTKLSGVRSVSVNCYGESFVCLDTSDGGDGIAFDHSVWVNPRFIMSDGSIIDATTIKPEFVSAGFGDVSTTKDPEGKPLSVASRPAAKLWFAHAPSRIILRVPTGAVTLESDCALGDRAMSAQQGGTTNFYVGVFHEDRTKLAGISFSPVGSDFEKAEKVWPQQGDVIRWHGCQLYRLKLK